MKPMWLPLVVLTSTQYGFPPTVCPGCWQMTVTVSPAFAFVWTLGQLATLGYTPQPVVPGALSLTLTLLAQTPYTPTPWPSACAAGAPRIPAATVASAAVMIPRFLMY